MKTIFLSHSELEGVSRFWDLYVKRGSKEHTPDEDSKIQHDMDLVLSEISDETRDVFLGALDRFELQGEEFQVRVAPDDRKFVRG